VWGSDSEIWAVGDGGTILRRTSNGWIRETSDTHSPQDLDAIGGSSSRDVWAVGQQGTILKRKPK
jgi:hypothetical protein